MTDDSDDESQLTVIEMMKMFHRENHPDVEIKITEVYASCNLLFTYRSSYFLNHMSIESNIV